MIAKDAAGDLKTASPIFIVGKSELALALAERIGGEIISVDSMQVYRGLNIGTAKPTAADRARVPHHLIDICDLQEKFDAAQFVQLAQRAVAEIRSRQGRPIFCGGTGLYFKAFLAGLGEAPATLASLRAELEATPLDKLLAELQIRDPATYGVIDRQNPRRIVRAIEVIRLTGKPFSAQRADWGVSASVVATPNFFLIQRPGPELHARINGRVEEMFRRGLVTETQQLLARGLTENRTAMQAIGYRQVVEHLRGERGLDETVELVKSRTRQFAKRQMTWFRRHARAQSIGLKSGDLSDAAVAAVLAGLKD